MKYRVLLFIVLVISGPLFIGSGFVGGTGVTEFTLPGALGMDRDPFALNDGNTGHLVWSTNDPAYCHSTECIMYSEYSSQWSPPLVIWDDGYSGMPKLVRHCGEIYVLWQSDSELVDPGIDDEIVMKQVNSHNDTLILVSPENDDQNDRMPVAVSLGSKLLVVWQRWTGSQYDIVSRCLDENREWGQLIVVSEGTNGNNWSPSITTFQGNAYAAWQSYTTNFGNDEGSDILVRSFDGFSWSQNISDITSTSTEDNSDTAICTHDDKLRVAWRTNDPIISSGDDWDIVVAAYDGSHWNSSLVELTTDDSGDDFKPTMTVFDDALYICWQSHDPAITTGADSDIVIRILVDGEWSGTIELTTGDGDRRDGGGLLLGGPALLPLDTDLMIIWETNTAEQFPEPTDNTWLVYRTIGPEGVNRSDNRVLWAALIGIVIISCILIAVRRKPSS